MPRHLGKFTGRPAAEKPWWAARQNKQAEWQKELKRRGVQFAIGNGPCKRRSSSACLRRDAQWVSGDAQPCAASGATNASSGWAGWSVPSALADRGASVGDPALYMPLLRKLEAGQPVTLLALGSSVVGAHAGCTAAWPACGRE